MVCVTFSGGSGGCQGYCRKARAAARSAPSVSNGVAQPQGSGLCAFKRSKSGAWAKPRPPNAAKSVRKRMPELTSARPAGAVASAARNASSVLHGLLPGYECQATSAAAGGGQKPRNAPRAASCAAGVGLSGGTSKKAHFSQRQGPSPGGPAVPSRIAKASAQTGPLSNRGAWVRRCAATQARNAKTSAGDGGPRTMSQSANSPRSPGRTRSEPGAAPPPLAGTASYPTRRSLTSRATSLSKSNAKAGWSIAGAVPATM
mmetsp:Transcript_18997/g.60311  ORF Transcript_18997/g.60311 Transcript_18997/m.60311 type:complete len:259 (-) Transcript_18997:464-1240(-)